VIFLFEIELKSVSQSCHREDRRQ